MKSTAKDHFFRKIFIYFNKIKSSVKIKDYNFFLFHCIYLDQRSNLTLFKSQNGQNLL